MKVLLANPILAKLICGYLQHWVDTGDDNNQLFLAILSAIPKPGKLTSSADQLRPISVTCIWYKLLAKVF